MSETDKPIKVTRSFKASDGLKMTGILHSALK